MANRLAYLADVYGLLPSRHTGGRKPASTDHAIHFLPPEDTPSVVGGQVASYYCSMSPEPMTTYHESG